MNCRPFSGSIQHAHLGDPLNALNRLARRTAAKVRVDVAQ